MYSFKLHIYTDNINGSKYTTNTLAEHVSGDKKSNSSSIIAPKQHSFKLAIGDAWPNLGTKRSVSESVDNTKSVTIIAAFF